MLLHSIPALHHVWNQETVSSSVSRYYRSQKRSRKISVTGKNLRVNNSCKELLLVGLVKSLGGESSVGKS